MECADCRFKSEIQKSLCEKEDCIGVFCADCREIAGRHVVCKECKQNLTCYRTFMCDKCPAVTWITPEVAIGSALALDSIADTVVDLNYPDNGCAKGEIQTRGNVLYLGVWNLFSLEELSDQVIHTLSGRILFRCRKGFNESVAMACLYLKKRFGMTFQEALKLAKEKRPRVSIDYPYWTLIKNRTKDRLYCACIDKNEEEIRRLAPLIDLNNTRFTYIDESSCSPLVLVLEHSEDTKLAELLLSLGEVVTPFDAKCIQELEISDMLLESYFAFFQEKGYPIRTLAMLYKGEYENAFESEDEYD